MGILFVEKYSYNFMICLDLKTYGQDMILYELYHADCFLCFFFQNFEFHSATQHDQSIFFIKSNKTTIIYLSARQLTAFDLNEEFSEFFFSKNFFHVLFRFSSKSEKSLRRLSERKIFFCFLLSM